MALSPALGTPRAHYMPLCHNFVERPSDAAELEAYLLPHSLSGVSLKLFVLHGLGGIGKTQLAASFARRNHIAFSSIIWLNASSELDLRQSFAQYGHALWVEQGGKEDGPNFDVQINVALTWLRQPRNRNWLLVLDNVGGDYDHFDDPEANYVQKYLPDNHGSVLVTTRMPHLSQLGPSKCLKKVDQRISKTIFERWLGAEITQEMTADCLQLLEMLDGLPLALAQAGSYLRETGCVISSYIYLYTSHWRDLMVHGERSSPILMNYRHQSINAPWASSYYAVKAEDADAGRLLLLWSCLDPTDLWYDLVRDTTMECNDAPGRPLWLAQLTINEARFLRAMKPMLRHSLVTKESQQGYCLHPVVHKWISHLRAPSSMVKYWKAAISVVGQAIPANTNPKLWVMQKRILPHADRCLLWLKTEEGEIHSKEQNMLYSITKIADLYSDQGHLDHGEALYFHVAASAPNHESMLSAVRKLGNIYARQKRLSEAESMYRRVIVGCEQVTEISRGIDPAGTPQQLNDSVRQLILDTCNDFANLCLDYGSFSEAQILFNLALDGKKQILGLDHPSTLNTINDLGSLYASQGCFEAAKDQFMLALDGQKSLLGLDHTFTLNTVNNIGLVYADQGRLQEGETLCRQALAGYEQALGSDHPLTLNIVRNIGSLLTAQGRYDDAVRMHRRAFDGCQSPQTVQRPPVVGNEYEVDSRRQPLYFAGETEAGSLESMTVDCQRKNVGYFNESCIGGVDMGGISEDIRESIEILLRQWTSNFDTAEKSLQVCDEDSKSASLEAVPSE